METAKDILICPYCGQLTKIIWVHGHGQCLRCRTIIDECCRGEFAEPEKKKENELQNKTENKSHARKK